MAPRPYKRRRLIIDPLQWHLLGITLAYLLAVVFLLVATIFGPLIWEMQQAEPSADQAALAGEFLALHTRVWPAVAVVFIVLAVHSMLTSHRIVGPLYRFRVIFSEVSKGNLAPWAGVRRRDLLQKEARALSEMLASLRDRLGTIASHHASAQRNLGAVERSVRTKSLREAGAGVDDLRRDLDELGRQLDQFRIDQGAKP